MLLAPQDSGGYAAQYLKPQHVESVTMPRPMFVFLNACQVGAGQRVLGDYAGLATAFLSAGAAGVVAALWNVHDLAARDVAVNFYRDLDADAVPVAAVLRRIRAQYTRQYADKDAVGRATLLAYQLFGHPDCAYQRSGMATPAEQSHQHVEDSAGAGAPVTPSQAVDPVP